MSHPPEYPGRQRFKRVASAAGSDAYQGAFEAIGAILVGGGFGYWADRTWDTGPWCLLVGLALGFAAMVLRLLRLGKELEFEDGSAANVASAAAGPDIADDLGLGEAPGLSDALRSDNAEEAEDAEDADNAEGSAPTSGQSLNAKNDKTNEKIDER